MWSRNSWRTRKNERHSESPVGAWPEYSVDFIRRRYDRLAPMYPLFEILFALPWGIRARAVRRLGLQLGDRVLEVGCGTGRNFSHLVAAVGRTGQLYGVDSSPGMLERARRRCARNRWENISLFLRDAADCSLPEPVNGVLFSLCYCVLPQNREALRRAWDCLRAGGNLVIMDAKPASGWPGKILTPMAGWLSRATVLGNPDAQPWEDLRELAGQVEMEEIWAGTYFVCRAMKAQGRAERA